MVESDQLPKTTCKSTVLSRGHLTIYMTLTSSALAAGLWSLIGETVCKTVF